MEHERPDVERPESRDLLPVCGVPPTYSPLLSPTRFFPLSGEPSPRQTIKRGKKNRLIRTWYEQRTATTAIGVIVILGVFFLVNWLMLSRLHEGRVWLRKGFIKNPNPFPKWLSSTQNKREPKELWQEPKAQALAWKPCADQRSWSPNDGENGYIMVTANGGINQQRVAVCNIVVVARLLNASLVIPKFMLSDVWTDASQFGDIYQEGHFINYLSPDIRIVKELPKELQSLDLEAIGSVRLRCRCNFHALNFVPRIQETGALIVKRLRNSGSYLAPLDVQLLGPESASSLILDNESDPPAKKKGFPSPDALRTEGLCPLTPEEAVLMLVALGFNRETRVFVAGAHIYGGTKRLAALTSLYPNLVTKEKLLSPSELQPFKNFSSQLAALDFIGCAAANAFAMTDSGSQLSSLVSGYRIYYGGGKMPTIRPNKRRLSDILLKNNTIEWNVFEKRVRKAIRQTKHVFARPSGRSVYRYPRCKECMYVLGQVLDCGEVETTQCTGGSNVKTGVHPKRHQENYKSLMHSMLLK
ncbi:hypothetical protein Bca4012_037959 [Brassica carinata]